MAITWPAILMPSGGHDPELRNGVKGGPPTRSGRRQRVFSDAGFWEYTPEIPIKSAEQARAWRALRARLRQGEEVNVRVYDRNGPPGFYGSTAAVTVTGLHAARSTSLTLNVVGIELQDGTYFSIGDRLYEIVDVTTGGGAPSNPFSTPGARWDDARVGYAGTVGASEATTVQIVPPLRAAAANATALSFSDLMFKAVLADPGGGDTPLDRGRYGVASATFREFI